MEKNAKIYLAGHTGLVGSALHRALLAAGYSNLIMHTFEQLDLRRQSEVEDFFTSQRPEYVFLAAAKVGGILANNTYPAEFIYDNLTIATNVIHASYKFGVKKLLNLGSSCIYPKHAPQPLKEEYLLTGPLEPTNEAYALAKIAAIKLCRYYNQQYKTHFMSLMPTNLYGIHDNFNLETAHVLPALLRKFHLAKLLQEDKLDAVCHDLRQTPIGFGKTIGNQASTREITELLRSLGITKTAVSLWGSGEVFREFLYVDDVAAAAMFFMTQLSPQQTGSHECFNIGTGKDISIKTVATNIKNLIGFEGSALFNSNTLDGVSKKHLDMQVTTELGWHASISLDEGLKKTYAWYTERQLLSPHVLAQSTQESSNAGAI